MKENKVISTLYEWVGGMPVFVGMFDQFYNKGLADHMLESVFKNMPGATPVTCRAFRSRSIGRAKGLQKKHVCN